MQERNYVLAIPPKVLEKENKFHRNVGVCDGMQTTTILGMGLCIIKYQTSPVRIGLMLSKSSSIKKADMHASG